jgi:hypothetical protein
VFAAFSGIAGRDRISPQAMREIFMIYFVDEVLCFEDTDAFEAVDGLLVAVGIGCEWYELKFWV